MTFREAVENVGKALDIGGVIALVLGVIVATLLAARSIQARDSTNAYRLFRQRLGRAILLGLELLVAADIIRTVAVTPTFESAGVLAIIVAIRTFLSISLEVELEGRWPWSNRSRFDRPPVA